MQLFILIERIFIIPFVLLKYLIKRKYIDQLGIQRTISNPIRLRMMFEGLGGVFMKFGQILAMRFDLLPINYASELLNLLDNANRVPNDKIFNIFLNETGRDIQDVFDDLNKIPIATASFAQVYKGAYNGESVVIKIQKPNIEKYIFSDLALLYFFTLIVDWTGILKAVSMNDVMFQLKEWLRDELDYTIEASNAKILYEHIKRHRLENVIVPKTYHELTTKRVLVQEFLDGFQVNKVINKLITCPKDIKHILKEKDIDLLEVSNLFIRDLMRQYFIDGIFHADPHPANLIIFPKNKIAYIDFGIIGKLKYNNFELLRYIKGVSELEFKTAADGMVNFIETYIRGELGSIADDKKIKTFCDIILRFVAYKLTEDFKPIINDWHFRTGNKDMDLTERSSATAFMKMVKAIEKYHMKLPQDVIAFIRTLLIIDMVCLKMANDFNMINAIQSFFNSYSLEKVEISSAIHMKEMRKIHEVRQTKENLENNKERGYIMKERFIDIAYILTEKYPELYNKIKKAKINN